MNQLYRHYHKTNWFHVNRCQCNFLYFWNETNLIHTSQLTHITWCKGRILCLSCVKPGLLEVYVEGCDVISARASRCSARFPNAWAQAILTVGSVASTIRFNKGCRQPKVAIAAVFAGKREIAAKLFATSTFTQQLSSNCHFDTIPTLELWTQGSCCVVWMSGVGYMSLTVIWSSKGAEGCIGIW